MSEPLPPKVLVVDDEPNIRDLLSEALQLIVLTGVRCHAVGERAMPATSAPALDEPALTSPAGHYCQAP
jgi:two-component system OmpR family response regulator